VFHIFFNILGTLVGLHLFSRKMKFDDAPLAAIACLMKSVSLMVLALAEKGWVMYAGNNRLVSQPLNFYTLILSHRKCHWCARRHFFSIGKSYFVKECAP